MKKIILLLLAVLLLTSFCSTPKKMKITYFYDALCGWCYGFSTQMLKLKNKYQGKIEFEIVSGGMITGSRIGPIGEVAPYIKQAHKDVEKMTGVKFGSKFLDETLEEGSAIFTSHPPSIALGIFKKINPEKSFEFAGDLQKAIYFDGIPPKELTHYGKIAAKYGQDSAQFMIQMQAKDAIKIAEKDYTYSQQMGITGFPTVVVNKEGTVTTIARGYASFEQMDAYIQQLINN